MEKSTNGAGPNPAPFLFHGARLSQAQQVRSTNQSGKFHGAICVQASWIAVAESSGDTAFGCVNVVIAAWHFASRRTPKHQNGFATAEFIGYLKDVSTAENRFLKAAIKQGLRMQDRFLAEPVLARTGKGYMKSDGVATLQRIKASLKRSKPA